MQLQATIFLILFGLVASAVGTGTNAGSDAKGGGSHSHMRKSHGHKTEAGEAHRHHVPKRIIPNKDAELRDPKRPPQVLKNPKLLQDSKLVHDREHIKEELPKYITAERIKQMSPRELDYHYFKIHDFDDNRKLDGLELMKALGHVHGHDDDDDDEDDEIAEAKRLNSLTEDEKKILKEFQRRKQEEDWNFYIELVDDVLEDNDKDKDGYLNYAEYVNGRNRNYGQQEYVESFNDSN